MGTILQITFLSQLFDPENSIKGSKFLSRLMDFGYEVSVVTAFPSYPAGKLYPNYSRQHFIKTESLDGVPVARLPTYINRSSSIIKRSLSYLTFGIVSLAYLFFKKKPDLLYVYYPPLIGGLVGLFLKKVFNPSQGFARGGASSSSPSSTVARSSFFSLAIVIGGSRGCYTTGARPCAARCVSPLGAAPGLSVGYRASVPGRTRPPRLAIIGPAPPLCQHGFAASMPPGTASDASLGRLKEANTSPRHISNRFAFFS